MNQKRLIYLFENSGQTKPNFCLLFQKLQKKHTPYAKIYEKLFPIILSLAVDVEGVSRQLFQTLGIQLVHWFSKNHQFESNETMTLLDSVWQKYANIFSNFSRIFQNFLKIFQKY